MSFLDLNNHHYDLTDEDLQSRVLFKDGEKEEAEVEGEPSQSEGAGTTAVRIIKQLQAALAEKSRIFKASKKTISSRMHST